MTNSPVHPMPPSLSMISRARRGAFNLTLLAGLFAGTVNAQVLVTDQASITSNQAGFQSQLTQTVSQYVKQGLQYEKQIQQYLQQVQQYEQMLTSVQNLASGGITLSASQLEPITDASTFIQESCPGASSGSILTDMASIVATSLTGNQSITSQQQVVCATIVQTQINKYNATVKVVNDTQQFGQELQQITSGLDKMLTQGDSDRMMANAETHSDQIASEMVDWHSQMAKDDAIISTLQQQQGLLAKKALAGSNTILGNVVQAGAFAAAFN